MNTMNHFKTNLSGLGLGWSKMCAFVLIRNPRWPPLQVIVLK